MLYAVLSLALILLDMLTKRLAIAQIQPVGSIPLIKGVFHLTYAENIGAAFSILQGKNVFFIVVVSIAVAVMMGILLFLKGRSIPFYLSVALILAGGAGNLVDRILYGYVIDFLDFRLIHFPIFNVADICVVSGVILLCIVILLGKERRTPAQKEESKHDSDS